MRYSLFLPLALLACAPRAQREPAAPAVSATAVPSSDAPANAGAPAAAPNAGFRCEAEVEAMGEVVTGRAEGEGKELAELEERAFEDACRALQSGGSDCRDHEHVVVSQMTTVQITNGKTQQQVSYRLSPVRALVRGAASTESDWRSACLAAVAEACKSAPAGTRCDANGTYCRAADGDPNRFSCMPTRKLERLDDRGGILGRSIFGE